MISYAIDPTSLAPTRGAKDRRRIERTVRRLAAGADLLMATGRMDIARMVVSWGDLKRG